MGWARCPEALGVTVRRAHELTGLPVLVTENGLPSDDDADRIAFIGEALAAVHAAMADGVPVEGYLYWSLLDNFEWALGYGPHFGLVAVDRETFLRTPKPSAHWFGAVARQRALP